MLQNIFSDIKKILIDAHVKIWKEITDRGRNYWSSSRVSEGNVIEISDKKETRTEQISIDFQCFMSQYGQFKWP